MTISLELKQKMEIFLSTLLSNGGNVSRSIEASGLTSSHYYRLLSKNDEFARAVEVTKRLAVSAIEDKLTELAVEGHNKPVFYQGKLIARERVVNPLLLMFKLKAEMPEKYGDRSKVVISNVDNGRIIDVLIDASDNAMELKTITAQEAFIQGQILDDGELTQEQVPYTLPAEQIIARMMQGNTQSPEQQPKSRARRRAD